MAKEEKVTKIETEFHKMIRNLLKEKGYGNATDDSIAFMVDNKSDDVCIDHNFMSTGIHLNKSEVSQVDVVAAGFKYCVTWHANV